jgi:hypothetical protein
VLRMGKVPMNQVIKIEVLKEDYKRFASLAPNVRIAEAVKVRMIEYKSSIPALYGRVTKTSTPQGYISRILGLS